MLGPMLVQAPSPTRSSGAAGAQHARPALRLKQGDGNVAPLRRGRAVAVGGIGDGRVVEGCQLVAATDLADTAWWIPAAAVWRDAACEDGACPEDGHSTERPNAIGLATARTTATAVLAGLSDRLGWEAVIALDRGDDIPALTEDGLVDEAGLDPSELVGRDAGPPPTTPASSPGSATGWRATGCVPPTSTSATRRCGPKASPGPRSSSCGHDDTQEWDGAGLPGMFDQGTGRCVTRRDASGTVLRSSRPGGGGGDRPRCADVQR